jgi:hypothetical protein
VVDLLVNAGVSVNHDLSLFLLLPVHAEGVGLKRTTREVPNFVIKGEANHQEQGVTRQFAAHHKHLVGEVLDLAVFTLLFVDTAPML